MTPATCPPAMPPLPPDLIELPRSEWREIDAFELVLPRRKPGEAPMIVTGDAAFLMDTVRAAFGLGR